MGWVEELEQNYGRKWSSLKFHSISIWLNKFIFWQYSILTFGSTTVSVILICISKTENREKLLLLLYSNVVRLTLGNVFWLITLNLQWDRMLSWVCSRLHCFHGRKMMVGVLSWVVWCKEYICTSFLSWAWMWEKTWTL